MLPLYLLILMVGSYLLWEGSLSLWADLASSLEKVSIYLSRLALYSGYAVASYGLFLLILPLILLKNSQLSLTFLLTLSPN